MPIQLKPAFSAIAILGVVACGTIFGAGLKTQQQQKESELQASSGLPSVQQQIEQLESRRAYLMRTKLELLRKLDNNSSTPSTPTKTSTSTSTASSAKSV